jgi:hypothetical protein
MLGPRGSGLITHPSADRGHGEGIGHSVCDDAKRRNRRKQLHQNREQNDWNECFQPPSHDFPKSASGVIAPRRVDVETTAEAGCRLSGAPSLTAVRLPGCGEQHPCRRGNTFRTDHGVPPAHSEPETSEVLEYKIPDGCLPKSSPGTNGAAREVRRGDVGGRNIQLQTGYRR